jgi:hypothetical protein
MALRYCTNQSSPFEEDQDGNAILGSIVFENGQLLVPETNPTLQAFLHFHPLKGKSFEEVDLERDAQKDVDKLDKAYEAETLARELKPEAMESVYRILFNRNISDKTSNVVRAAVIKYAKDNPDKFVDKMNSPEKKLQEKIRLFFEHDLLKFRRNKKEVWFNTSSNKGKMLNVPTSSDPYEIIAQYLKTDTGILQIKMMDEELPKPKKTTPMTGDDKISSDS